MTPLDYPCPHIDRHGLHCGAEKGDPCVEMTEVGPRPIIGYHASRIMQTMNDPPKEMFAVLTPAERDVGRLMVDGHGRESTARQRASSINTIERHIRHINRKLRTTTRQDVIVRYYQTYWEPKRV